MHRISPNNPVRRLFANDELIDQSNVDNLMNVVQELHAREMEEKRKKWNFDFENEVPLEGDYEWFKCDGIDDGTVGIDGNKWVRFKPDTKPEFEDSKEQDFLEMRLENEVTPKSGVNQSEESSPLVRKRKKEDLERVGHDNGIRRKINFE